MSNRIRFCCLYVFIFLLALGCARTDKFPANPALDYVNTPDNSTRVTPTKSFDGVNFQVLASHENFVGNLWPDVVVSLGWLTNDRIFLGIGNPFSYNGNLVESTKKTDWYFYDLVNLVTTKAREDQIPFHGISLYMLKELQLDKALSYTSSLDKTKILYTKSPIGYVKPIEDSLPLDYVEPTELWISKDNGKEKFPILQGKENWYLCGSSLNPDSKWLSDNTLIFSACTENFPNYFLVDITSQSIEFLNFYLNGEYFLTDSISMANQSMSLALIEDYSRQLWVVPVDQGQREIPTNLTQKNLLFQGPAIAPVWSANDQWIYYWTFDTPTKDTNGSIEDQPWWLEKINVNTLQRVTVLSEQDLLSFMDYDMYRLSAPMGAGNRWSLSHDEKQILLFLNETSKSPATLFLISLN